MFRDLFSKACIHHLKLQPDTLIHVENVDVMIWMGGKTRDPDHVGEEMATALFVFIYKIRFLTFYESLVDSLLSLPLKNSGSCFLHSMRLIREKQVGVGATAAALYVESLRRKIILKIIPTKTKKPNNQISVIFQ